MRDANRIDKILEEVRGIWKRYPDLRLTQLIMNLSDSPMLYYIEDNDLIDALKRLYGEGNEEEKKEQS